MIVPIVAYGNPVLKKISKPVQPDYPELQTLIANMWETMYNGRGVGLAAPQVGINIRLFIVDSEQLVKDNEAEKNEVDKYPLTKGIKKVFINPEIIKETGEHWLYEEGCLSIPEVRVKIYRHPVILLKYFDENFQEYEEEFDGLNARIIQHEHDHLEGILLTDRMSPLKRSLIKKKLENISIGKIDVKYKMKFVPAK